jgi:divalent metal cation (Fe/Co/Zn/Cd) transporter
MLAVPGALIASGLITILKFIAAVITGSSGMTAESPHSPADTTNQVFPLLGLRFYNDERGMKGNRFYFIVSRSSFIV